MFYSLRNKINYIMGKPRRYLTVDELTTLHASGQEMSTDIVVYPSAYREDFSDTPKPAGYRDVYSKSVPTGYLHDITVPGTLELRDNSYTCINVTAKSAKAKTKTKGNFHTVSFLKTNIEEIICHGVSTVNISEDMSVKTLVVDEGRKIKIDNAPALKSIDTDNLENIVEATITNTPNLRNSISMDIIHLAGGACALAEGDCMVFEKLHGERKDVIAAFIDNTRNEEFSNDLHTIAQNRVRAATLIKQSVRFLS